MAAANSSRCSDNAASNPTSKAIRFWSSSLWALAREGLHNTPFGVVVMPLKSAPVSMTACSGVSLRLAPARRAFQPRFTPLLLAADALLHPGPSTFFEPSTGSSVRTACVAGPCSSPVLDSAPWCDCDSGFRFGVVHSQLGAEGYTHRCGVAAPGWVTPGKRLQGRRVRSVGRARPALRILCHQRSTSPATFRTRSVVVAIPVHATPLDHCRVPQSPLAKGAGNRCLPC